MILDHAKPVQLALCSKVRRACLFGGVKPPKVKPLASNLNGCQVSTSVGVNADPKNPKRVTFCGLASVLAIVAWVRLSQIAKPVVGSYAVYVVKKKPRPLAMHMQPSKSVGSILVAQDANKSVPGIMADVPGFLSGNGFALAASQPRKNARLGIVVQKLAQSLRGKIGLSHEALQLLIGQRPASVSALRPASLFY